MSLNDTSINLLMKLVNAAMPVDKRFTAETFSVTEPTPYTDPGHPEQNTQVTVAYREDPMIRYTRYYPRPALEHVARNADSAFTVAHGSNLSDLLPEINTRLGLKQQPHEFKELEFFTDGEYVLEPRPENLLLIGYWKIQVTVTGAPAPLSADGPENPGIQGRGMSPNMVILDEAGSTDDQSDVQAQDQSEAPPWTAPEESAPPAEGEAVGPGPEDVGADDGTEGPDSDEPIGDLPPPEAAAQQDITEEQAAAVRAYLADPKPETYDDYHNAFSTEDFKPYSDELAEALLETLIERYPALAA